MRIKINYKLLFSPIYLPIFYFNKIKKRKELRNIAFDRLQNIQHIRCNRLKKEAKEQAIQKQKDIIKNAINDELKIHSTVNDFLLRPFKENDNTIYRCIYKYKYKWFFDDVYITNVPSYSCEYNDYGYTIKKLNIAFLNESDYTDFCHTYNKLFHTCIDFFYNKTYVSFKYVLTINYEIFIRLFFFNEKENMYIHERNNPSYKYGEEFKDLFDIQILYKEHIFNKAILFNNEESFINFYISKNYALTN